ncbi:hypothetical protein R4P70_29835 [Rhodococcus sp. IEGM 1241]|uniref:hypothetical protein n=1 Tax=Rhodococcus sp. IEGM 1241 TaxID=3082228 RepID=UPI0029558151|nr:hypothetical protein [Rhodococcus sp. IEGM 1241]MDV8015525.1 hypothetical protein [Rhodococcus sp. IEGM 1241]
MTKDSLYTPEYRRERRRHALGWVLVGLGAAMALLHVITHLGQLHFLSSAAWQDLLLGYPMAFAIAGLGFLCVLARSRPSRS